ncbi:MAG: aspartate aminotransferase family protein [Dehalococcoidia bacterium]|nr:aspartate aminotransferase family protein [Dehalococcoidia bacterium]
MSTWQEREARVYMQTGRRQPVTLVKGQGLRVWDDAGKEYLDFVGGWAVNTLGHCHPAMVKAIEEQARTLFLASNQFYTTPQIELAELLVANSCLQRVFIANSGAEANEGAVKLARKWGKLHRKGAYEVITALNSFHGRTLAMVSATGNPHYQEPYEPIPAGFLNVPYNDIEAIKRVTTHRTCAVMLEPVQGEAGVIIPAKDYLKQVRAWCDEQGLLLILDEVQTGVGRLGTMFGYQQAGVEPDVMTLGKGLGGGVPIAAFLAKESAAVLTPGDHGSTYGGNPLVCHVAKTVVQYVLAHNVLDNVRKNGERLQQGFRKLQAEFPFIQEVRGRGLLQAVQFTQDISADVLTAANQEGLLLNAPRPNTLRFMPPLVISAAEVDEGLAKFSAALAKAGSARKLL